MREVRGRVAAVTTVVVVAVLAAAGAGAWRLGWVDYGAHRWLRHGSTTPAPPWHAAAAAVATPTPASGDADATKIKRAIHGDLRGLGRVLIAVAPLHGGDPVFTKGLTKGPGTAPPASLNKLLTAAAALSSMSPETTFATTTTLSGSTLTLSGGGDPLLSAVAQPDSYPKRADLQTLAARTAAALKTHGTTTVQLAYDTSLWTGPALSPHWPPTYVPDHVIEPLSPLWADEGRTVPLPPSVPAMEVENHDGRPAPPKAPDPAAAAAVDFATDLAADGIAVAGPPTPAPSPPDAQQVAEVRSAPLRDLLAWTLQTSDNEAAETIARHVGIATGHDGSFDGAVAGVTEQLQKLGIDTSGLTLYDGSGLSRDDRASPRTLVQVIQAAAKDSRLGSILDDDVPVAGFSGSLEERFGGEDDEHASAGRGVVRAKTGTLTGVDALAGTIVDADGDPLAFVVMGHGITNTLQARAAIDRTAADLAACHCAAG